MTRSEAYSLLEVDEGTRCISLHFVSFSLAVVHISGPLLVYSASPPSFLPQALHWKRFVLSIKSKPFAGTRTNMAIADSQPWCVGSKCRRGGFVDVYDIQWLHVRTDTLPHCVPLMRVMCSVSVVARLVKIGVDSKALCPH